MQKKIYFVQLVLSSILLAIAQITWKIGLRKMGGFTLQLQSFIYDIFRLFTNVYIFLGLLLFSFATIIWLLVLSEVELSVAYPILSLGYVFGFIAGVVFFNESVSFIKILGLVLIVTGIVLISFSAPE